RTNTVPAALLARPSMPATALPLPKESAAWVETKSAHFTLLGDVKDRRLRDIASDLERFRAVLDQATGLTLESTKPTRVYVFARTATFQQYTEGSGTKVMTG